MYFLKEWIWNNYTFGMERWYFRKGCVVIFQLAKTESICGILKSTKKTDDLDRWYWDCRKSRNTPPILYFFSTFSSFYLPEMFYRPEGKCIEDLLQQYFTIDWNISQKCGTSTRCIIWTRLGLYQKSIKPLNNKY